MIKKVKFFLDVYGVKGCEIQTITLSDQMSLSEIEISFRKIAMTNDNENVLLYSQEQENEIIPFHYSVLSDQVKYRLVVTRRAGKI